MTSESDLLVDRRRLRRKLSFWRVAAIVVAIAAVIGLVLALTPAGERLAGTGAYVARISINGLIRSDQDRVEALDRLGRSSAARAVIVHINSPGGTTAGSEQLHEALLRLKEKKPVVVMVEGLAASGGYMAAIAADHIVAQSASLVGSIGVLVQFPNVGELLKTVGVKVEEVKSSPLKAAPNGFEPTSPEARAALESLVRDSYDWFRTLVKQRRGLDDANLATVADGRVFTGRQALALKLIDELGQEQTARDWLTREKGIAAALPVRNYRLQGRIGDLSFLGLAATALDAVGLSAMARQMAAAAGSLDALRLDGLMSVWHPSAEN